MSLTIISKSSYPKQSLSFSSPHPHDSISWASLFFPRQYIYIYFLPYQSQNLMVNLYCFTIPFISCVLLLWFASNNIYILFFLLLLPVFNSACQLSPLLPFSSFTTLFEICKAVTNFINHHFSFPLHQELMEDV